MSNKKKAKINVEVHPEFPATSDSCIMTSTDLARHVNSLMNGIFADYAGCKVLLDQQADPVTGNLVFDQYHPVRVELYFAFGEGKDTDKCYAFRPITDRLKDQHIGGKMNYIERCLGHNIAITQNKSAEITQDGIDIISSILRYDVSVGLSANPSPKEFANRGIVAEATSYQGNTPYVMPNTQKLIYNVINYTDINSILNVLFGNAENGSPMVYQTIPIKPVIMNNSAMIVPNANEQKWLFNVSRINQQNLADKLNELGAYNITSGMNIITETA